MPQVRITSISALSTRVRICLTYVGLQGAIYTVGVTGQVAGQEGREDEATQGQFYYTATVFVTNNLNALFKEVCHGVYVLAGAHGNQTDDDNDHAGE